MDIKSMRAHAGSLKSFLAKLIERIRAMPVFSKIFSYLLRFGTGFLLAQGTVLGEWSPFGIAFSAALGASEGATFGIVGTILGYLRTMNLSNGLKYIAICILIYTSAFIFRGTSLMKRSWFMPLCGTISTAAVGLVFVLDAGFPLIDTVFFISEAALVLLGTCAYQFYFNPDIEFNTSSTTSGSVFMGISLVLLISSLLLPLCNIELIAGATLGRSLAILFIMVYSYYGGIAAGSCAGVISGLTIGIAHSSPSYCAIYGFSAITSAIFASSGKLLYTVVYLIANAAATFWITAGEEISILYEAFFASVPFLLTGEIFSDIPMLTDSSHKSTGKVIRRTRDFTQKRLALAGCAFAQLSDMLSSVFSSEHENIENIASVFDHPASRVCRKCKLSSACWEKDYISTRDALNSVTGAMKERGRICASDFPLHFTSRCIHIEDFLNEVNRELLAFQYRRQFRHRIEESRKIICRQYRGMSEIFEKLSSDLSHQPKFDFRAESRLERILSEISPTPRVCVFRDCARHLHIQIEGGDLSTLSEKSDEYLSAFSEVLGISLTLSNYTKTPDGELFSARQTEPFSARIGTAVGKKENSPLSGDSGSFFKLEDGRLCVILSDGMGSGRQAAAESASAIRMLEHFLKAGIAPSLALTTINSALVVKNSDSGSFTTLDFMCVDLFTGECDFYKYGSSPSYIKRGKHIRRILSSSLPAGVPGTVDSPPVATHIKLHFGDAVVLASDGIADSSDDIWLQELLGNYSDTNAKDLATAMVNSAVSRYGKSDDMTAIVICIGKT